ncbi:MAG: DUF4838 domain-containing protein [Clostridia bacterium]|nr:DUF4838 domain-containing protein [Clostridia bacterium]
MIVKINTLIGGDTVAYAKEELIRCLSSMDATVGFGEGGVELTLGLSEGDPEIDSIDIKVEGGSGYIKGANPRAVLIAAYRFLYELGCRWTYPGVGGEHIPMRKLDAEEINVEVRETPSRRYRGICIEGAVSEQNVRDMIEFIPRVGMNSYFFQFFRPTIFFNRWYGHTGNPTLEGKNKSAEEIDAILARLVEETKLRGLLRHGVGHGWTCVPFGIEGEGWNKLDVDSLPREYFDIAAEVGGKRQVWDGVPLNTNLCYSRADVRSRMADAVVDYCKKNPDLAALHLWLADSLNNNCECPACRDTRPSDYYVMLLNEVDEKLTKLGLDTKVVFLIYVDLLWAPEREKLNNPDRFIMMFAPITRTYAHTLKEGVGSVASKKTPFVRNKLEFPADVGTNIAYLEDWKKIFSGTGFIFDYHLMWDHATDPGYMAISRTLFDDMKDLDYIGLEGMISCQLSRTAMPTGLPVYGMARALWDKDADFEAVTGEYFAAEYGEKAETVRSYLEEITRIFDPNYLRKPYLSDECAARFDTIPDMIKSFLLANPEISTSSSYEPYASLAYHAELCIRLSRLLSALARGEDTTGVRAELKSYVHGIETSVQDRLDVWNYSDNLIDDRLKDVK